MGAFAKLPTAATVAASRRGKPISKGPTRLEVRIATLPITAQDDRTFRTAVWNRDRYHCRRCKKPVMRTLARVPERGEVHHVHGRVGDLKLEIRAALLLCLVCHERVTGRIQGKRLVIVASQTFTTTQGTFTDARATVRFRAA